MAIASLYEIFERKKSQRYPRPDVIRDPMSPVGERGGSDCQAQDIRIENGGRNDANLMKNRVSPENVQCVQPAKPRT